MSISRKLSTNNGSSSLDDIFLATSISDSGIADGQRHSMHTEAFIDALVSPDPNKGMRRVSAPGPPSGGAEKFVQNDVIPEVEKYPSPLMLDSVPMSYSADDLNQLLHDADKIGPSKWKKYGLAAG